MALAQAPPPNTNELWNIAIQYHNFCNAQGDESQENAEKRTDLRKAYEEMLYKNLGTSEDRVYFSEPKLGEDDETLKTQIFYRVAPEKWASKGHSSAMLAKFTAYYARIVEIPQTPYLSASTRDKDSADPVLVKVLPDQPAWKKAMCKIAELRVAAKQKKKWGDLNAVKLAGQMFRDFGELLEETDVTLKERWLTRHFTSDY